MAKIIRLDTPYKFIEYPDIEKIVESFSEDNISIFIQGNSPKFYNSISDIIEPIFVIISAPLFQTLTLNLISNTAYDSFKRLLIFLKGHTNQKFLLGKNIEAPLTVSTKLICKIENSNGTSIHFEMENIPSDKIDLAFTQLDNFIKTIPTETNVLVNYEKDTNEWNTKEKSTH